MSAHTKPLIGFTEEVRVALTLEVDEPGLALVIECPTLLSQGHETADQRAGNAATEDPTDDCDCQIVHAQIVAGSQADMCVGSDCWALSVVRLDSAPNRARPCHGDWVEKSSSGWTVTRRRGVS
jgi:hypothetical protein